MDQHNLAPKEVVREEEEEEDYEQVEIPYQYEVEEVQEMPVVKEQVVEKVLHQVKAMYPYKGQGMVVDKGEVRSCWIVLVDLLIILLMLS